MPKSRIDVFNIAKFEAALPHNQQGNPVFKAIGCLDGEHTWVADPLPGYRITVRSSIGPNGTSAGSGANSIRAWLNCESSSVKTSHHITRLPGWPERLTVALRSLWRLALVLDRSCPACKREGTLRARSTKKVGANKGRVFIKCDSCPLFKWWDEAEAQFDAKKEAA